MTKLTGQTTRNRSLREQNSRSEFVNDAMTQTLRGSVIFRRRGEQRLKPLLPAVWEVQVVMDRLLAKFQAYRVEVTSGRVELRQYARMLAEVGHPYATAELGFLPRVIEGQCEDEVDYVGCLDFKQPQKVEVHNL